VFAIWARELLRIFIEALTKESLQMSLNGNKFLLILAIAGLSLMVISCGPNTIAPLPSPAPVPSPLNILVSSLTVDENKPKERLVAIVGTSGAVEGLGEVRLSIARKAVSNMIPTTEDGAFCSALMAIPGDVILVSFINTSQEESEPIELVVSSYTSPELLIGGGMDTERTAETPPQQVGTPNRMPQANTGDVVLPGLTLAYADGIAQFTSTPSFIGNGELLIIANEGDGAIYSTNADETGAIAISFPASPGDSIILFSQNPLNPELTSPAQSVLIPNENE